MKTGQTFSCRCETTKRYGSPYLKLGTTFAVDHCSHRTASCECRHLCVRQLGFLGKTFFAFSQFPPAARSGLPLPRLRVVCGTHSFFMSFLCFSQLHLCSKVFINLQKASAQQQSLLILRLLRRLLRVRSLCLQLQMSASQRSCCQREPCLRSQSLRRTSWMPQSCRPQCRTP